MIPTTVLDRLERLIDADDTQFAARWRKFAPVLIAAARERDEWKRRYVECSELLELVRAALAKEESKCDTTKS